MLNSFNGFENCSLVSISYLESTKTYDTLKKLNFFSDKDDCLIVKPDCTLHDADDYMLAKDDSAQLCK